MNARRVFFKNFTMEGPVFPTMLTHMASEPSAILIVQGNLNRSEDNFEMRDDITDWRGVSKGGKSPVFDSGSITAVDSEQLVYTYTPHKNELLFEAHWLNHTKNSSSQIFVLRIQDKGDHYWLHEVQVSPKERGQDWFRVSLERMLFSLADRFPDYPDKKPVRTLARVVEGIPQKELVRVFEETGFKKLEEVDGGVLMEFNYEHFNEVFGNPGGSNKEGYCPVTGKKQFPSKEDAEEEAWLIGKGYGTYQCEHCNYWHFTSSRSNPPRSKPFPWNKARVAQSPFKTMKRAQAAYDSWKKGMPIGFSATSSLKSMGRIPRASGKYELGEKYETRSNPGEEIDGEALLEYMEEIQSLYNDSLQAIADIEAEIEKTEQELEEVAGTEFEQAYIIILDELRSSLVSHNKTATKMESLAKEVNEKLGGVEYWKNPRTKKGRAFPKKYLKGLNATEKAIAMYEIDKGYEYDVDDPKAYEFWVSDIKSKARGLKTVPSKWRNQFAKKYGPMKDGRDFLGKVSNTTGVERKYLKKIYDKGLAAWRVGHRPGVQQHQWAAGRVYAFVMGAPSSTGPGKPDHKLAVKAGVR